MTDVKALSIMMGTGGMAVGFENAGVETVAYLENNPNYGAPTRRNFPDAWHTTDMEEWDAVVEEYTGEIPIVYGNPPCQGLTGANKAASPDHWKNKLFPQAVEWAVKLEPEIIAFENIPRMLSMGREHLAAADEIAKHHGYHLSIHRHAAGDFGVSQRRPRVMFVWSRRQYLWPSHEYRPPATVKDAISDLYEVTPNDDGSWMKHEVPPQSEYQELMRLTRDRAGTVKGFVNHYAMWTAPHHSDIPQGGAWMEMERELLTDKERERLDAGRIFNAAEIRRLREDKHASTVTAMQNKMHPLEPRLISVREAARLMGFPDWFEFPNSWDYGQMSAGVCPPVTEWFAKMFSHVLAGTPIPVPVGRLF